MTHEEAKGILRRCRPGAADAAEPEVAEALEWAARHPELADWWAAEQVWQQRARAALQAMQPPPGFREAIIQQMARPQPRPRRWRGAWPALAMAAALALAFLGWRWQFGEARVTEDSPPVWRQRMARVALREYRMDIVTNSLAAVNGFFAAAKAPVAAALPPRVQGLSVMGGAALKFQNRPVSMTCFDRGDGRLLWLFAIDARAMSAAPTAPQFEQVGALATQMWTADGQLLLLAIEGDEPSLRQYL